MYQKINVRVDQDWKRLIPICHRERERNGGVKIKEGRNRRRTCVLINLIYSKCYLIVNV